MLHPTTITCSANASAVLTSQPFTISGRLTSSGKAMRGTVMIYSATVSSSLGYPGTYLKDWKRVASIGTDNTGSYTISLSQSVSGGHFYCAVCAGGTSYDTANSYDATNLVRVWVY